MQHESFICGVVSATEGLLGTGFAIGKRGDNIFILTAGHVLESRDTPEAITDLRFVFQGNKMAIGRVVLHHSMPDVENGWLDFAIVHAHGRIKDLKPAKLRVWTHPNLPHTPFQSIGATSNLPSQIGFKDYTGVLEGIITYDARNGSWRYRTKTAFPLLKGFSGGPLIVSTGKERAVIGVQTHRNGPPKNSVDDLHLLNFATPIARILESFPDLQRFID